MPFTPGDVSGSYQLTDDDHLYNTHINELRRQSDGVYNALYYGTTMSGVEIQAAIDAANAAGGGTVLIPDGTWTISTTITIPSNIRIMGNGDNTVLKIPAGSVAIQMFNNSDLVAGNTNISLESFKFDGNNSNRTGSPQDHMLYFAHVTDVNFQNITCVNGNWHDIEFHGCSRVKIDGWKDYNNKEGPLVTDYTNRWFTLTNSLIYGTVYTSGLFNYGFLISGQDWVVDNCIAYDCGDVGFAIGPTNWTERAKRITISNCMGFDTRDYPFFVSYGEDISISNCIAHGMGDTVFRTASGGGGIGFQYVDGLNISDNICTYNYMSGIQCSDQGGGQSAKRLVIKGNVCLNNDNAPGTQAGILLYAEAGAELSHTIVEGNICGDTRDTPTQYWGIRATTGTNKKHLFRGNLCFGNKSSGIAIAASSPGAITLDGNYCLNNGRGAEGYGIQLSGAMTGIVSNNYCLDDQTPATQYYGIEFDGTDTRYLVVSGNNCRGNKRHGIYFAAGLRCAISNNVTVANSQQTVNTYSGIYLNDTTYCSLVSNVSSDTQQKYGIESAGTSDYLEVIGNTLVGNGTAGSSLAGVNNDSAHNLS